MKRTFFFIVIFLALGFDIWFSEQLPKATIFVVILSVIYKLLSPFLRI